MDFYSNPEVILSMDCRREELVFYDNKRLGDTVRDIDLTEVTDIYYKGEKNFARGELLSQRLEKLVKKSGYIHVSNGTSYSVDRGVVVQVKLLHTSLGKLSKLKSDEVVRRCGEPDDVEEDLDPWDAGVVAKIYVYKQLGIQIYVDTETKRISEVRVLAG